MRKIKSYYEKLNSVLNMAEEKALIGDEDISELLNSAKTIIESIDMEVKLIESIYKIPEDMIKLIVSNEKKYTKKCSQLCKIII